MLSLIGGFGVIFVVVALTNIDSGNHVVGDH